MSSAVRTTVLLVVALGIVSTTFASEPSPATLYEVVTDASTTQFKLGESGRIVIEIRPKEGAHVSDEAPLRIELSAREVSLEKHKLTLADSVGKKRLGQAYADPRFEVGVNASRALNEAVEAKLTFFICTDTLCARQQKSLTIPVEVISPGS